MIDLPDAAATEALGRALAADLAPGDVVLLQGDLGSGKTTLARALIEAAAGEPEAPSPTYALVQTYEGASLAVAHFDLYRLDGPDGLWELGWDDALDEGVVLVEWPERLGALAPAERLVVALTPLGDGRRARLEGTGRWPERLAALKTRLAE